MQPVLVRMYHFYCCLLFLLLFICSDRTIIAAYDNVYCRCHYRKKRSVLFIYVYACKSLTGRIIILCRYIQRSCVKVCSQSHSSRHAAAAESRGHRRRRDLVFMGRLTAARYVLYFMLWYYAVISLYSQSFMTSVCICAKIFFDLFFLLHKT